MSKEGDVFAHIGMEIAQLISAVPMSSTIAPLPPEEQEQLLQTIEMFEVIVQANPQDCQSMEILRDAYQSLGMKKEMVAMSKRLATSLVELAQYSAAMLEFEALVRAEPDNPELMVAMGEIEEKIQQAAAAHPAPSSGDGIDLDFQAAEATSGTLMTTSATLRPGANLGANLGLDRAEEVAASLVEDGNEALANFLIQHRLVPESTVNAALARIERKNSILTPDQLGASLIDEIVTHNGADHDTLLCGILERTKFAYIPIEYYEIDRQIVRMLPESITLNRLILPFDLMSRTLMVATANPFDVLGKQAVHQLLDYNIQWHLASPTALIKVLSDVFKSPPGRGNRSAPAPAVTAAPAAQVLANEVPELNIATSNQPAAPDQEEPSASLPDTSAFRLNK